MPRMGHSCIRGINLDDALENLLPAEMPSKYKASLTFTRSHSPDSYRSMQVGLSTFITKVHPIIWTKTKQLQPPKSLKLQSKHSMRLFL